MNLPANKNSGKSNSTEKFNSIFLIGILFEHPCFHIAASNMSSFRVCWRTHFISHSKDVLDFNNFQGQELILKWHTAVACTKASRHPNKSIASNKIASEDIVLLSLYTVEAKKNNGIPLYPFLLGVHQPSEFMNKRYFSIAQRPL